ncbi:MAG: 50S ribosomal protein L13 [Phycisphaera sp.]|nr:50S ribosomal protein L13 [Phycisphaera sp.]
MNRQTYFAKPEDVDQKWHLIDADGKVVGRMATEIATILMGKHKPTYTPHVDTGDFVVVINAAGAVLTGRKAEQKFAKTYSGYPGGLKHTPYSKLQKDKPERLIELAVRRMLPKTSMGEKMFSKLKVYAGSDHPHTAQQPQPLEL